MISANENVNAFQLQKKAGNRKKANAATTMSIASLELIVMQNLDKKQCAEGTRTFSLDSMVTSSILMKGATIGMIVVVESVTQRSKHVLQIVINANLIKLPKEAIVATARLDVTYRLIAVFL